MQSYNKKSKYASILKISFIFFCKKFCQLKKKSYLCLPILDYCELLYINNILFNLFNFLLTF